MDNLMRAILSQRDEPKEKEKQDEQKTWKFN